MYSLIENGCRRSDLVKDIDYGTLGGGIPWFTIDFFVNYYVFTDLPTYLTRSPQRKNLSLPRYCLILVTPFPYARIVYLSARARAIRQEEDAG